jgi:hypothetical protein
MGVDWKGCAFLRRAECGGSSFSFSSSKNYTILFFYRILANFSNWRNFKNLEKGRNAGDYPTGTMPLKGFVHVLFA